MIKIIEDNVYETMKYFIIYEIFIVINYYKN